MKVFFLTFVALFAFASNSILCRIALSDTNIDPIAFSSIRLLSGAFILFILVKMNSINAQSYKCAQPGWLASICLFVYAIAFSFAYINIPAGTGAFILFSSVQIFMFLYAISAGSTLASLQWFGSILAMFGLILLLLPGMNTPPMLSSLLMILAGGAWALFSILGKLNKTNALRFTMLNFIRTLPLILILNIVMFKTLNYDLMGVMYAVASGSLASGVGYAVWYYVLPRLSNITSSIVQLLVPVLTALFGVIVLDELITLRFVTASFIIITGIVLVLIFPIKASKLS